MKLSEPLISLELVSTKLYCFFLSVYHSLGQSCDVPKSFVGLLREVRLPVDYLCCATLASSPRTVAGHGWFAGETPSVRFWTGTLEKAGAGRWARSDRAVAGKIPKVPFLGLSLLLNPTETLAMQAALATASKNLFAVQG